MLRNRLPSDTFVTAFLGVLVPEGLRYCNAGHLPPLRVRGGAAERLSGHALPLAIDGGSEYEDSELGLDPGDLVFAYTDGLAEARRGGDVYGLDRLEALVAKRAKGLSAGGPGALGARRGRRLGRRPGRRLGRARAASQAGLTDSIPGDA